jgi:DNA polymerase-3 subunit delta'
VIPVGEILGQEGALELLARMRGTGRIPHALLFHGPEGVGKGSVALAFAAALLCEDPQATGACGLCAACRMVRVGSHPDLLVVTRLPKKSTAAATVEEGAEAEDLSTFIVVQQIRELTRLAALAPRRGRRRVFVLDPADRMNFEAQNALLKTLEEPPGSALLILVASRPHQLLATVRSRSTSVGFAALRVRDLASRLTARGMPPDEAMTRAALAEGRPGRALALDPERERLIRERVIEALESLSGPRPALGRLTAIAEGIAGKTETHFAEHIDMLTVLLRDAARASLRPDDPALVHADLSTRLGELGGRLDPVRVAGLLSGIDRLRAGARLNLNRLLSVEALLAAVAGGPLP